MFFSFLGFPWYYCFLSSLLFLMPFRVLGLLVFNLFLPEECVLFVTACTYMWKYRVILLLLFVFAIYYDNMYWAGVLLGFKLLFVYLMFGFQFLFVFPFFLYCCALVRFFSCWFCLFYGNWVFWLLYVCVYRFYSIFVVVFEFFKVAGLIERFPFFVFCFIYICINCLFITF